MPTEPPSSLPDDVGPPSGAIRLGRMYRPPNHACAAEVIGALDPTTSGHQCADLVDLSEPMARLAEREGTGYPADEIGATLPRGVKRMCGDAFPRTMRGRLAIR